jgi:hypothetical protein
MSCDGQWSSDGAWSWLFWCPAHGFSHSRLSLSYMLQGKSDPAQATNGTTPDNDNRNPGK